MENKIVVSVPNHVYFRRRRVKQALEEVEKIFLNHKIPFEIVEDMGREFTAIASEECASKRESGH